MTSTFEMLSEKVKILETENALLKNMLKQASHASCRFIEMLAKMDQLLVERNGKIYNLAKSLEFQVAKSDGLRNENTLAALSSTNTYRYVEMLSEMDELLVRRKKEIGLLTKSLDKKNAEFDKLKNQLLVVQTESTARVSENDYYETRKKRSREIENIKKHKTEDGLYQCRICEFSTKFWFNLETHIRGHTGEKPFKCDQCPQRFADQSVFKRHTQIHKNDRPFRCTSCGSRFNRSCALKMHCKLIHSGEGFSLKRYQQDLADTEADSIEEAQDMTIEFQ